MYLGDKELENSANAYELVGTVSEYNLTLKQNTQKVKIDDEEKTINSSILYGTVVVDVNGTAIKNNVLIQKFKRNGDEQKQFRGLCTVAGIKYDKDNYEFGDRPLNPAISGVTAIVDRNGNKSEKKHNGVGKNADRIRISGQTDRETYLNKDQSDLVVSKRLSVGNISTEVTTEDKASFDIGGCVYAINDEYDSSGNVTGRKIVDLVNVGFFGGNVFSLIVPKEWTIGEGEDEVTLTAQDFLNFAKVGQTITAHGDIEGRTVGRVVDTNEKKSFGKKSDIRGGYTVVEWVLKGGDLEKEQYNTSDISQIKREYNLYLDQEYKNKLEQQKEYLAKKNGNSSNNGLGLGARSTTPNDKDNPFADMSDDPFA